MNRRSRRGPGSPDSSRGNRNDEASAKPMKIAATTRRPSFWPPERATITARTLPGIVSSMTSDDRLEAYARLVVEVGANVGPGQPVDIEAHVEHAPFVRALARAAYRAGARSVEAVYKDKSSRRRTSSTRRRTSSAPLRPGTSRRIAGLGERGGAVDRRRRRPPPAALRRASTSAGSRSSTRASSSRRASARSSRPHQLDARRLPDGRLGGGRLRRAGRRAAMGRRRDHRAARRARPGRGLARRTSDGSTPARPRSPSAASTRSATAGPGTDLTVGLLPGTVWRFGRAESAGGRTFVPEHADRGGADLARPAPREGTVRSTRPLALQGTVVRDLELRFEGGRIVEVRASAGADVVRAQLATDEGASPARRGRARRRRVARRPHRPDLLRDPPRRERHLPHRLGPAAWPACVEGADGPRRRGAARARHQPVGAAHRLHGRRARRSRSTGSSAAARPCRSSAATSGSSRLATRGLRSRRWTAARPRPASSVPEHPR